MLQKAVTFIIQTLAHSGVISNKLSSQNQQSLNASLYCLEKSLSQLLNVNIHKVVVAYLEACLLYACSIYYCITYCL